METNPRKPEKNDNGKRALLITAILLLLTLGWMTFKTISLGNKNDALQATKDSLTLVNKEMTDLLAQTRAEITRFKTEINSKDSLILVYQEMLVKKEERIKVLIAQNNSLQASKRELVSVKKFNTELTYKIKLLEERNQALEVANKDLTDSNESLKARIRELEEKLGILSKKVEKGSILKITNLTIVTEKKDKKGQYVKVKKAKKADRLSIHFDINENQVADKGSKVIYVRAFDPKGKLIEGKEAGTFTNVDQNVTVPYTKQEKINFANSKQKIVVPVELNDTEPTKGDYKIEVYTDGYFSGSDKIKLK
jgi:hypothetical protein